MRQVYSWAIKSGLSSLGSDVFINTFYMSAQKLFKANVSWQLDTLLRIHAASVKYELAKRDF